MKFFATDNAIVDALGEVNFSGNITPQIWYKTIVTEKGKPHYLAISILSDIVYWYRPTEVRDEQSGRVIGWKKRFRDDLLQRNYEQFAEMYGESKKTIARAVCMLEELGVIARVFRTITLSSGMVLNNVLYLDLNVKRLVELTYPEQSIVDDNEEKIKLYRENEEITPEKPVNKPMDKSDTPYGQICREGMDKTDQRVWTDLGTPVDKIGETLRTDLGTPLPTDVQTNTETLSKITNRDYINPIHLSAEETESNVDKSDKIDKMDELSAYMQLIRENIEYDHIMQYGDWKDKSLYEELYSLICEVVCVKHQTVKIGGDDYPYELVKSKFLKLTSSHLEYVIGCMHNTTTKINNIKAYMITALYNAPNTMNHYYQQEVQHDMYGGGWDEKGIV